MSVYYRPKAEVNYPQRLIKLKLGQQNPRRIAEDILGALSPWSWPCCTLLTQREVMVERVMLIVLAAHDLRDTDVESERVSTAVRRDIDVASGGVCAATRRSPKSASGKYSHQGDHCNIPAANTGNLQGSTGLWAPEANMICKNLVRNPLSAASVFRR